MSFICKVLRIIAHALMGLVIAIGILCFAYTVASSQFKQAVAASGNGIDAIVQTLEQMSVSAASQVAEYAISQV